MDIDFLTNEPFRQWLAAIVPQERIFVAYLLSAFVLAYISYLFFRSSTEIEKPDTSKGFLKYVFGDEAYTHKSARQDYFFFLTNAVVFYFFAAQFLMGEHIFAVSSYQLTNLVFGPLQEPLLTTLPAKIAYTLVAVMVGDFAIFITHYLMHRNPILWNFHMVHHSAEVLNPMTLHRMHPLDLAFTALISALLIGISTGIFFYLAGGMPQTYTLFGLNIVFFLFYVFGYNLRHSHIWLSFGKWGSYIFISPAQHQIHHSVAMKHRDKNFGLIFSFWDRMFGTLYFPEKYEKIEYGIDKKEKNPFKSTWELYVMPFKWSFDALRKGEGRGISTIVFVTAALCLFFWYIYSAVNRHNIPSVYTEELTWTEIQKAQKKGYDTVIIPTGGTEQNGAHVVTGKHNYVVRHAAGEIARKAGRALVAPVIAYVPEDQHINYPGTIHIPEKLYQQVLLAAGDSFAANGFKHVFFLGDSFGNQAGQEKAAEALEKKWAEKGVIARSLNKYYDYKENGQVAYLLDEGYTPQQIGGHAGIRDTSELMFVEAKAVRKGGGIVPPPDGKPAGHDGDYKEASKKTGKKMLELKINAGVREIKESRGDKNDNSARGNGAR